MESLKDRWFQADTNPTDQLLNEQEFLSFLHPEHSKGMLRYMVKEIVRDLGEFLKQPPSEAEDSAFWIVPAEGPPEIE